jgi:sugar fermentation stimulation protein A
MFLDIAPVQLPVPLQSARLVRRYKRFLADCDLEGGGRITAHIADPGRLPGLALPGTPVHLSESRDPKRKLPFRVELIEAGTTLVGANTANANRLAASALAEGLLPSLAGWQVTAREPRLGPGTRLDFALRDAVGRTAFLEVKNITWRRGDAAAFPDAVTARGARHLATLAGLASAGTPAFLLFVCQRADVAAVSIARDIDPAYAAAFDAARDAGVRVLACRCDINQYAINIAGEIPMG